MKKYGCTLLCIFLTACTEVPSVQFYVLESSIASAPAQIQTHTDYMVGIGPITVPALLTNKKIITRSAASNVTISDFHQWAAPLDDDILQTITRNITKLQPYNTVRAYPWSIYGMADLQVVVEIIRFDVTTGISANLEANWTIKNEKNREILKIGRSTISHPFTETSYQAGVLELSNIIAQFSQELSSEILQVSSKYFKPTK